MSEEQAVTDASAMDERAVRVGHASLPARRASARSWFALLILTILYVMAYVDRQVISLLVAPIRLEFDVSDFQISLVQGLAFAVLFATCGLPLGMAVDRFSRRWVVYLGVTIWSIAAISCGLAVSFGELLTARIFVGMGEAAIAPAAYSLLAELFPKRRLTFALGIFTTGSIMGAEGSLAIGSYLLGLAERLHDVPVIGALAPWRFVFIATGAPGLAMAFLAFLIREPAIAIGLEREKGGWLDVFRMMAARKGFFASHFAGFTCVLVLGFARLAWNATYLARRFHWETGLIGSVLSSFGFVMGMTTSLAAAAFIDHRISKGVSDAHFRFMAWGGFAAAILGPAAYLAPTPVWFFGLMVLPIIPLFCAGSLAASAIQIATPPAMRGRVSALYLLVGGLLGMSTGPALVASLTDFVFRDDASIHLSLALTFGALGPAIAIIFLSGRKAMRALPPVQ